MLDQIAMEANIVKDIWGKHAHTSKVVDNDSTPSKIRRLSCVAQVHFNYQCSMILEDLVGITDLNALAELGHINSIMVHLLAGFTMFCSNG
jgi:hypothetical protein